MVCGIGILYKGLLENEVFLNILLILNVIGSFVNTHLFNPTKDKYCLLYTSLVIGLIAAIFVICLSVPAFVYKATSDETVIERLHNFEN